MCYNVFCIEHNDCLHCKKDDCENFDYIEAVNQEILEDYYNSVL